MTPHQVLHPQCPKAPTGTYGSEAQAHPRQEMASDRCTHVQRGGRVTTHQVLHPQCPKAPAGTYGPEAQAHPRQEMHLTGALTSSVRAAA